MHAASTMFPVWCRLLFVLWHTMGSCMKFTPSPVTVFFTISIERLKQSFWFQSRLLLVSITRDRGWCSPSTVYPSNSQPAKRSPWDHRFLSCFQSSLLLLPFTHPHTPNTHRPFNSYHWALCCFTEVPAGVTPELQDVKKALRGKRKTKVKVECQNNSRFQQ